MIRRVIHATADFDFARALHFTPGAVEAGISALRAGAPLVLDTNMALAGVSQPSLARLGSAAHCLMAEEAVAQQARAEGTTRAVAAARRAAQLYPQAIFAVGNAPTTREGRSPASMRSASSSRAVGAFPTAKTACG